MEGPNAKSTLINMNNYKAAAPNYMVIEMILTLFFINNIEEIINEIYNTSNS